MRFGKIKLFFILNSIVLSILLIYFAPWLFSHTVMGRVVRPYEATTVHIQYEVENQMYTGSYMRNGVELSQRIIAIRYLRFDPGTSRINSFMGMWAEPLAWWGVFLLASAMLLLTHNTVFSKGTVFQLHKKFPWISMEEYFPLQSDWFYYGQFHARSRYKAGAEDANARNEEKYLPE